MEQIGFSSCPGLHRLKGRDHLGRDFGLQEPKRCDLEAAQQPFFKSGFVQFPRAGPFRPERADQINLRRRRKSGPRAVVLAIRIPWRKPRKFKEAHDGKKAVTVQLGCRGNARDLRGRLPPCARPHRASWAWPRQGLGAPPRHRCPAATQPRKCRAR